MHSDPLLFGAGCADVVARLREARGFVFDMDGTLVLGDQHNHGFRPLPGASEIIAWLQARGIPFVIYTNGTTRPPAEYAASLQAAGLPLNPDHLMTPASSAVDLFVRRGYRRVVVLGGEGLAGPLRAAGIEPLAPVGKPEADAVLIGWYREVTLKCLEAACHAVWGGAQVFSASQALFFATAAGRTMGTSRPIAAVLRDATRCKIHIVGKPSREAIGSASRRLGVRARDLAVVGDDPELEMPMAHRGRAIAVAVTTGLADAEAFGRLPVTRAPHLVLGGVGELLRLLRAQVA